MHIIKCSFETDVSFFVYNLGQEIEYILHVYDFGQKAFYLFGEENTLTILWWRRAFLLPYLTNWAEVYEHSNKLTDNMFRILHCIVINMFMSRWGGGFGRKSTHQGFEKTNLILLNLEKLTRANENEINWWVTKSPAGLSHYFSFSPISQLSYFPNASKDIWSNKYDDVVNLSG